MSKHRIMKRLYVSQFLKRRLILGKCLMGLEVALSANDVIGKLVQVNWIVLLEKTPLNHSLSQKVPTYKNTYKINS